jgi:hypothetical protein
LEPIYSASEDSAASVGDFDHVPDFYDAEGSAGGLTDYEVDHNHIAANPNDSALSCIDSAFFFDTVREQLRYVW